jgi:3-oxoacyl-[acyl-carrier-protein] synthase-3
MSFSISGIQYALGERQTFLIDYCKLNQIDYDRLIPRTGFEILHTTELEELEFYIRFLETVLYLDGQEAVIFVNQSLSRKIPGAVSLLFSSIRQNSSTTFFELSDGCSGFVRALILGNSLISSSAFTRVHIICAEKYSNLFPRTKTSVATIFSDAISVTTLTPGMDFSILATRVSNDFDRRAAIAVKNMGASEEFDMAGAEVLTWANSVVSENITKMLDSLNLDVAQVSGWYLHQGSKVVVEGIAQRLGIESDGLFTSRQIGNTASSTIPIAMAEYSKANKGLYSPLGINVLSGFGIGLTAASVCLDAIK